MEENRQTASSCPCPGTTQIPEYAVSTNWDWMKDSQECSSPFHKQEPPRGISDGDLFESMLCVPGSKLVPSGLKAITSRDDIVLFVNAGGGQLEERGFCMKIDGDSCFQGGDVLRTEETITDGGNCPSLYQSARFGNFSYKFDGLAPGGYFIDLHFAEIIYTNGPKGMRVFDVFVQEEKVLSEVDIYAVVGFNKPLQLVNVRVSVAEDGVVIIRFEGVHGSPTISGICIRKAPKISGSAPIGKSEHLICNKCASEIEFSPTQSTALNMKSIIKYEKKIQELSGQCQLKTDECYEAWMSLTDANEQLQKLRMELDNKLFQAETLDQDIRKQTAKLKDVSERYVRDRKYWVAAVSDLEAKIKSMKREHSQLSQDAHECANSIPELNKMIIAIQDLVAQCEDLKLKYSEEQAKRKNLYNQVQETKGNIRVFCRCRPLSKEEVSSGYMTVVDFESAKDGDLGLMIGGSTKKSFKFDRVYTPKDDQVDVFADASPLVTSVLDGYNVCIFAYGQTGTGKTFTMEGTEHNRGVNYRTLEQLFKLAKERKETFTYNISVSVLEVYNEQIRDLLATSPSSKKLEVRQAAEGVHHVPGIVEAKVENIKEVWDVLQAGSNARVVGSNNVNEHSSRSHCMLCIMVRAKNILNGDCTKSKLWLVDLAGSERLAKTDVQGERLKEAQNINRSLSALGDVISALAVKSSHIPYRNSKLTHLLQDSLGGDSKTLMFVQISPSENDMGETLSSLNFATRVRGVEVGPAKKQIDTGELQKMKQMLDKVRQESRFKEDSIRKLEENFQNLESKVRGKDQLCRNLQEKIKELEGQLQSKAEMQSLSDRQYFQHSEKLKVKEELCITLQQKVKELENKLEEQQKSDSLILQHKVKEFENKLKERQNYGSILEQKNKELEYKVKEFENKLRERKQSESMLLLQSADALRIATPTEGKTFSKDESTSEIEPQILRSSNSINKPAKGPESVLLRGMDSLHEIKRKRQLRNAGDSENNVVVSNGLLEKKLILGETNRPRKIDSAKAYGRITRTSKVVTTKRLFTHTSRLNKEQPQPPPPGGGGTIERDKIRGWSR